MKMRIHLSNTKKLFDKPDHYILNDIPFLMLFHPLNPTMSQKSDYAHIQESSPPLG